MDDKDITYRLYCKKGFLGAYRTIDQAMEYLKKLGNSDRVMEDEGTYIIKRSCSSERIEIPR